METTSKKIVIDQPAVGEKIDAYLIRQMNANPDTYSTAVIDECAKITNAKVTRFQLPGPDFDVQFSLFVWWNDYEFKFKKQNDKWSKY